MSLQSGGQSSLENLGRNVTSTLSTSRGTNDESKGSTQEDLIYQRLEKAMNDKLKALTKENKSNQDELCKRLESMLIGKMDRLVETSIRQAVGALPSPRAATTRSSSRKRTQAQVMVSA
jgi:hypothetical protein